jgi:hypothetical protein
MIFVLVGGADDALEPLVQQTFKADDFIKIGAGQWLVSADGSPTSKDVWLKITTAQAPASPPLLGIVFPVANGYFGLAPTTVWEWIAAKRQAAVI